MIMVVGGASWIKSLNLDVGFAMNINSKEISQQQNVRYGGKRSLEIDISPSPR